MCVSKFGLRPTLFQTSSFLLLVCHLVLITIILSSRQTVSWLDRAGLDRAGLDRAGGIVRLGARLTPRRLWQCVCLEVRITPKTLTISSHCLGLVDVLGLRRTKVDSMIKAILSAVAICMILNENSKT
jgi:hypothetical protein